MSYSFSPTKATEDKMGEERVQNKKKKSPLVLTVIISNVLVHPVLCTTLLLTQFISTLVIYVFSSCNCIALLQSHGACSSMVTDHPFLPLGREQCEQQRRTMWVTTFTLPSHSQTSNIGISGDFWFPSFPHCIYFLVDRLCFETPGNPLRFLNVQCWVCNRKNSYL